MTWDLDAERDLWRAICAPNRWYDLKGEAGATHPDSYYHFLAKAWGAEHYLKAHPEQPQWLYEPIHRPFSAWMQKHLLVWKARSLMGAPGRYYIAVVLPRGYGKTVSATKAGSVWSALDEPDMSAIICSATAGLSQDTLTAIAGVLAGKNPDSWFTWLYGNWRQGADVWKPREALTHSYRKSSFSENSFDVTGVDAGMTGYHHRQHWWDDPLIKNKLREGRDAWLRAAHDAVNASYNALQANGLLVFVLTRYLDDDIAGRHFREEGIATWTGMECPHVSAITDKVEWGQGSWHVFFYQTEDELTGEPTHPKLWTKDMIAEAKRRDPEDFSCQQQNNPGSGERAPLVESQVPYLYLDYKDFLWQNPVKWATIHIDTAFKRTENIRKGDDNAIVVWLHDSRDNGLMYLDTDLLRASNEWREEDFNRELVRCCLRLRARGIHIRAITDETEPGGKAGTYKNRILGVLQGAGIVLGPDQFITLNRRVDKKARIRTGAGVWAEGYVRLLLWKGEDGQWNVPVVVRKLISQIVRVDVTTHDDLADAATDGFIPQLWSRPLLSPGMNDAVQRTVRQPGDDVLKGLGSPTNEELTAWAVEQRELEESGRFDFIRGSHDPFEAGSYNELDNDRLGL